MAGNGHPLSGPLSRIQSIETFVDIDAPPSVVWNLLTDLSSYPEWNPHIVRARGDLRVGSSLDIRIRRKGVKDRDMTVTISELEPERRLAWVGTLLHTRIFEGRHVYELEPLDGSRTRLHNRESVRGLLASSALTDDPARDYEAMNRALKSRAEQAAKAT